MELRGVEPLSENKSTETSTIIAYLRFFPQAQAGKQAGSFCSFMNISGAQSLAQEFTRKVEARIPMYGNTGADPRL